MKGDNHTHDKTADFKLQKHELESLLEHGQVEIIHRENQSERLRLELTEDVETEKQETWKVDN